MNEAGVEAARRWVAEQDERLAQYGETAERFLDLSERHPGPMTEAARLNEVARLNLEGEARVREHDRALEQHADIGAALARADLELDGRIEARIRQIAHEVVAQTGAPLVEAARAAAAIATERVNRLEDLLEVSGIDVGRTAAPDPAPDPGPIVEPTGRQPVGYSAAYESAVLERARVYWPAAGTDDLIAIGPLGSRRDWLLFNKATREVATGWGNESAPCFLGDLANFLDAVNSRHSGPNRIHNEYNAAVRFLADLAGQRHR